MLNLKAIAICIAVILGLGWLVLYQTGKGAQSTLRARTAEAAISEAVETRKADLKADATVASKNRVALDSVRRGSTPARKYLEETSKLPDRALPDPEWDRVFNGALSASREAVQSARRVP